MRNVYLSTVSRRAMSAVGVAILVLPAAAIAQTTPNDTAATAPPVPTAPTAADPSAAPAPVAANAVAPDTAVGEVVVTAQKRSERLLDVPMSITAATGEKLIEQGVRDVSDLVKFTPGLNYVESGYGTPVYAIRGIGFYDTSLGATPAVTVYVDQVPLAYPQQTRNAAFDLERVEILKGPQGTLFGQNSTGGAINYIAAKPTSAFHAGFEGSYGRFNDVDLQGFVSGPITETLSARVAVRSERSNDWQYSYTRRDTHGATDILQGRVLLDWHPASNLKFELAATGWRDRSDTPAAQLVAATPNLPQFQDPRFAVYPLPPRDNRAADFTPGIDFRQNDTFYQVSLRGDYEFASNLTLTSITAYSELKLNSRLDGDGTVLHGFEPLETGRIKSFNQEVRLAGSINDRITFVLGGNYGDDKIDDRIEDNLSDGNTVRQFQPALRIPRLAWFSANDVRSLAGFGNVNFKLTDKLTLQGGARYTDIKRGFEGCLIDIPQDPADAFIAFTGGNPPFVRGGCYTFTLASGSPQPTLSPQTLHEHNTSWRASLNWAIDRDTLLYANLSRGYKAGTFPTLGGISNAQYAPATQESVLAYEAGFKVAAMNRRVQIIGAGFYYDYTDKQLRGNAIVPIFGPLEKLVNIPKSYVWGAELSLNARPTDHLKLSGGATYLKSKVTSDFPNFSPYGAPTNFKGLQFPYTPHWQMNGDAEYDLAINERMNGFVGGNVFHQSGSDAAFQGGPLQRIHGYTTLDLRAGVMAPDGAWKVSVFGRNVTNTFYATNISFIPPDATIRFTGRPATYGIAVALRF